MAVSYEWDIETVTADEYEDILDHTHAVALADYRREELIEALSQASRGDGTFLRLVLVRDVGNEVEGLLSRSWAYVTSEGLLPGGFGMPPDYSDFCFAIPQRYHRELWKVRS